MTSSYEASVVPPTKPRAIILGGAENALSVARSLGQRGISVHAISDATAPIRHSRFCQYVELGGGDSAGPARWEQFLLSPASDHLRGAVLLCCSDEAIQLVIRRHEALSKRFILEEGDPEVRLNLLDKLRTYELARRIGLDTPRFWHVEDVGELERLRPELQFPVILKPLVSYEFGRQYGRKFLRAENGVELARLFQETKDRQLEVVIMEFIPGSDDRLCSYYTYLDSAGAPVFHFTKRIIRRSPVNMGGASYHVTDWIPEAMELGLKFFRGANLRGLGNIEFKRDHRDGKLKIIECNARVTAADCLIRESGLDLPVLIYNQLTGGRLFPPVPYRLGLHLWKPSKDLDAFLELRRRGETSLRQWLSSLLHPQVFPTFSLFDPLPALAQLGSDIVKRLFPRAERLRAPAATTSTATAPRPDPTPQPDPAPRPDPAPELTRAA